MPNKVKIEIKKSDLRALDRKLKRVSSKLKDKGIRNRILLKGGNEVLKVADRTVPVRTGATKNSIKAEIEGDDIVIGPKERLQPDTRDVNVPYYLEYGTSRTAPQPYMRPAAEGGIPKATTVVKKEYRKLVKSSI